MTRLLPMGARDGLRRALVVCSAMAFGVGVAIAADLSPTVKITTPQPGEAIGGQHVLVTVEYYSNSGAPIDVVELWVDQRNAHRHTLVQPLLRGRVRYEWDSTQYKAGTHTLEARARDTKGYEGTALVTVSNAGTAVPAEGLAPYINIFQPADGATITGTTKVEVDVHPGQARFVYIMLDGKMLCATTNSPYVLNVDTNQLEAGPHTIYAVAKTDQGEVQSEVITVNVGGAASYVGPDLPTPSLIATHDSLGPELALPRLPLASADEDEMGGGLIGGGLMLAAVNAPRVISTPTAMTRSAALTVEAPTVAAPAPAPATRISIAAGEPTPVSRPTISGVVPRVTAPTTEAAPVAAALGGSEHGSPVAAPMAVDVPKAVAPDTNMAPVSVPTRVPEPRPRTAERVPAAMAPAAAGPARPAAVAANAAATAPTAVATPSQPVTVRAPRMPSDTPSYRISRTTGAVGADPVAAPAARSVASAMAGPAADAPTARAKVAEAARLVGANRALVRIHVVRAAESLQSVSARYGVSVRRIAGANNLEPDAKLTAGERLTIPPQTTILFDDVPIAFDVEPMIMGGVAVAPIRHMLEAMGGTVYWLPKDQKVQGVVGDKHLEVQVGSREAKVNEEKILLDIAAFMKRDRVLVPVRFVGEALDVTVRYDPVTENVHIVTRDAKSPSLDADAA